MPNYDIIYLSKKAEEIGFTRDALEKVIRLADILEYLNTNTLLKNSLALKGGTAINLTIFNLPRLSVDLDLDYLINNSREEMLAEREVIHNTINRYMTFEGYSLNPKTKNPHSMDSWVYSYQGTSGNRDNIKIEINYSLRSHILEAEERPITAEHFSNQYKVKSLAPLEIYGSKISALLNRIAARDLYDTKNMIQFKIFDESEAEMLKKCIIFYTAITTGGKINIFNTETIDSITNRIIKRELLPVLKKKDDFELKPAQVVVKEYISDLMILGKEEKEFLNKFEAGKYIPELLFQDKAILGRIKNHPMALWKIR